MKPSFKTLVVAIYVSIFLFQLYFGVVQVVDVLQPSGMVKSFSLESVHGSVSSNTFSVGDTMKIVACSDVASVYNVEVYRNASVVFEGEGRYNGSTGEACVFLNTPEFKAGVGYSVVLDSYSYNTPILGVTYQDSEALPFAVVATATQLTLNASYESAFRNLRLYANLTSSSGYPVVNEMVGFEAKFFDRGRPTDGWTPLGSSRTNASGIAEYTSAFCVPDGNYSFMAYHNATDSFGSASDTQRMEITYTGISFTRQAVFNRASYGAQFDAENSHGFFSVAFESCPTALLPTRIDLGYYTNTSFSLAYFCLFLDVVNSSTFLGLNSTVSSPGGSLYAYEYSSVWTWVPECTGEHHIIVTFINGTILDLINGTLGRDFFDESSPQDVEVYPCPASVVVYSTPSSYSQQVEFTVAVCKPRTYQVQSTGYSASSTLAPHISYAGLNYVVDDPVNSCSFDLYLTYLNTTTELDNCQTNSNGIFTFNLPLEFGHSNYLTCNFTVVAPSPNTGSVLKETSVQRIVNFTKVQISNLNETAKISLGFNSTFLGCSENSSAYYVGAANSINDKVSLFGSPLGNAPVQFIIADNLDRVNTTTGKLNIPENYSNYRNGSYLRVFSVNGGLKRYNFTVRFDNGPELLLDSQDCIRIPYGAKNVTLRSAVDVNGDWKVNVLDLISVATHLGNSDGPVVWIPQDVNRDGKVNVLDLIAVSNCTGTTVKATVEFSTVVQNATLYTDNLGYVQDSWTPNYNEAYLVQTKLPSNCSVTVADYSGAVSVKAAANNVGYFTVLKRPVNLTLDVTDVFQNSTFIVTAKAYDPIIGEPITNLNVTYGGYWNHPPPPSKLTNTSGMCTWTCVVPAGIYFDVPDKLVSSLNGTYQKGYVCGWMEWACPTNTTFQGPNPFSVGADVWYNYAFNVTSLIPSDSPAGCYVDFYVEGTFTNGTHYVDPTPGNQPPYAKVPSNGQVIFRWGIDSPGTFIMKAVFVGISPGGTLAVLSSECSICLEVTTWPMAVLFSVTPSEFIVGTKLDLNATIINVTTNERLADGYSVEVDFYNVNASGNYLIGSKGTSGGVATYNVVYPSDNHAHAYFAKIVSNSNSQGSLPQGIASNTVQLTVSSPTELLLNVTRDPSSTSHTVKGYLMSGSQGLSSQTVTVTVNQTAYKLKTGLNGSFSQCLGLQPANNLATSYVISANFTGNSTPMNVTAWSTTLNSTLYPACTTIQYGYSPAVNTTTLIVTPQSDTATVLTKTPEQMQQQAQTSGWLNIYSEFSWLYPWYRLHIKVAISSFMVDVGFNPVLPFGETLSWKGLNVFSPLLTDAISDVGLDPIGLFAQYLIAKYAAATLNFVLALAVEAAKAGAQGSLLLLNWSNRMEVLADAMVSFVMAILALGNMSIAESILNAVCGLVETSASTALQWVFNQLDDVLMVASYLSRTWVDGFEVISDIVLGGTALGHYFGLW